MNAPTRRATEEEMSKSFAQCPRFYFYELTDAQIEIIANKASERVAEAVNQTMFSSIPNGDHEGHRLYHEAVIKRMQYRAKLWEDVSVSATKWGILGALGWVAWAVWHEFILTLFKAVGKA